jgi:hypothetical protein
MNLRNEKIFFSTKTQALPKIGANRIRDSSLSDDLRILVEIISIY